MPVSGRFAALRDKAKRGFRGYPVATIAHYGPDATQATKVAVGIILAEGAEPSALERWHSADSEVRFDQQICGAVLDFIAEHHVKTVAMSSRIIGCPHEEGIDYPLEDTARRAPTGPTAIDGPARLPGDCVSGRGHR